MNWLGIALSYFAGSFTHRHDKGIKESVFEIYDEVIIKSRRVVTLGIVGIASVVFLCGGLFITLLGGTLQYDQTGSFRFSATMAGGLILVAVSLLTFAIVFGRAWPREHKAFMKEEAHAKGRFGKRASERHAPSLDQSLSLLIMDFIKNREAKREARYGDRNRQEGRTSRESSSFNQH